MDVLSAQRHDDSVHFEGLQLDQVTRFDLEDNMSIENIPLALRNAMNDTINLITNGMKDRFKALVGDVATDDHARVVKCFSVFVHDKWPEDNLDLQEFGVQEINFLMEWFREVLVRY